MSGAHLHLILAHVPIVSMFLSLALLAYAVWRRDSSVRRIALAGIALSGLIAVPVYFSGEGAEEAVEELAGVAEAAVERHEEAAGVSAILMAVTGVLAALGVYWTRKGRDVPRALLASVALSGVVAFGAIGYTANLGGQIRHTEIAYGSGAAQERGGAEQGESEEGKEGGEDEDEEDDDRKA